MQGTAALLIPTRPEKPSEFRKTKDLWVRFHQQLLHFRLLRPRGQRGGSAVERKRRHTEWTRSLFPREITHMAGRFPPGFLSFLLIIFRPSLL